jgi:23S rRNA G2445 N2-methylase RlmL
VARPGVNDPENDDGEDQSKEASGEDDEKFEAAAEPCLEALEERGFNYCRHRIHSTIAEGLRFILFGCEKIMNRDKELYKELRGLAMEELWRRAEADLVSPGLIRAVGARAGKSERAREWLRGLLAHADEKVRRYAVNALPKVGAGEVEEKLLLARLKESSGERERAAIVEALEKIGGRATLAELGERGGLQRVKAAVAQGEGGIRLEAVMGPGVRIHLHCRSGLENILRQEVEERGLFEVVGSSRGLVAVRAWRGFSLRDIFAHRCFALAGFALPFAKNLAETICSALAREVFKTFTNGVATYRIEFVGKGHQRAAVKELAELVHARCPELLNSPSGALWTVAIVGKSVELRAKIDPRFAYRQEDVPAASHPPLAACMARLAGAGGRDVVWDPFCGSGLELIERALLGGVKEVIGSDRSAEAIEITQRNFIGARVDGKLLVGDFREIGKSLRPNLIVTNPPMGKRVPIPDLEKLMEDLFLLAGRILPVGGRLVLANPLKVVARRPLKLEFAQLFDMGGFHCRLEKYVKIGQ